MGNGVDLPVLGGPCCVGSDWIYVGENDVGTCGVLLIVVVVAI